MGKRGVQRVLLRPEHALGEALAVAQIDEDNPAVVAGGINPTDERDGLADVGFAELVAVVGAHGWKVLFYMLEIIREEDGPQIVLIFMREEGRRVG